MSKKDSVAAAQFDRKITIQQPVISADAQGTTTTWSDYYTCFADIQDFPHGRGLMRQFFYQQLYPQATTTIQIRYQQSFPIDPSMRIKFVDHGVTHIFQILGIQNPNRANVSLFLLCREDQAKAVN